MMKKMIAVLLAIGLTIAMAACAKQPAQSAPEVRSPEESADADGKVELRFAWWGNRTRNERTQKVLTMYTAENPEVTFTAQFADWEDYWDRLAPEAAGHVLPDIIQMDAAYLQQYRSHDLLLDLTPYIESGVLDVSSVEEQVLDFAKLDGGIYALCAGVNVPALLYNKTLLDEAGITIRDNMNMDEFLEVCRQVYEKTGYRTNIAYGRNGYMNYYFRGLGENVCEESSIGVSRETLEEYYSLYENGTREGWLIPPSVFSELTVGSVEQDPMIFGSGPENMSWCNFAHSNQLSSTVEVAPEGMEIGITTWPSHDPAKSNYLKPSQFFAVTTDSKHPEEAVRVLNYITNSVACNRVLLVERGIPISSVVSESIMADLSETDRATVSFVYDVVVPNSTEFITVSPPQTGEVYTLNDALVEKVCYGKMTAAEAAEEFLRVGNLIMAG